MTTDEKTLVPSLIAYIRSDLFTLENVSTSVTVSRETVENDEINAHTWDVVIKYLPLDFFRLIESYPDMVIVEEFDKKYIRNPKLCAYERYGLTNMWRPLMILNRCASIVDFDFPFIKYYNIERFTSLMSVLIARCQAQ